MSLVGRLLLLVIQTDRQTDRQTERKKGKKTYKF